MDWKYSLTWCLCCFILSLRLSRSSAIAYGVSTLLVGTRLFPLTLISSLTYFLLAQTSHTLALVSFEEALTLTALVRSVASAHNGIWRSGTES